VNWGRGWGVTNFLGNFWNIAKMHNYTDFVPFLEKSMVQFLRKVAKTSFFGHFWPFLTVFGQNEENGVKYQKSAQYIFLPLHVSYFIPSFRKIV
jgi:hypothetical protein